MEFVYYLPTALIILFLVVYSNIDKIIGYTGDEKESNAQTES